MSQVSSGSRLPLHAGPTTHPALHIRDARDALIVLEAVRLNILPLITRRLSANERDRVTSGNVFVWEEAEFKGGLERWTDGRRWSQSRMRGDYLFYEEKIETTQEERDLKAARRARRALDPLSVPPLASRRQDRPSKPDGLTKQTYSTQVYLPGQHTPRKWHIVAYFSGNDYTRLPVIDNYDYLRNLHVPEGVFISNKGGYKRIDPFPCDPDDDHSEYSPTMRPSMPSRTPSSSSTSSSTQMLAAGHYTLPSPTDSTMHQARAAALPRLSTVVPMRSDHVPRSQHHPGHPLQPGSPAASPPYAPLSAEDRRVLSAFRVVL